MAVTLHAHTMSAVLSGNRGAVGVGIADITFNDDYTMTITLTDGSTYTSGNLRGAQGIPGIDAEFDGEELVITTGDHTETDGGEVSTIRVKGEARTIRDRVTEEMACGAYPTETASGDIVSISDGAEDIPVKTLSVAVEPVQAGSGDPSPDNVRAITGWDAVNVVRTGKNLFNPNSADKEWVRTSDWAIITQNSAKSVRVKAVEGDTFTLSNANTASGANVLLLAFLSSDGTVISRNFVASGTTFITRTAPANTASLLAAFFTWTDVSNAQLELGASATAYEPYHGTTYPIPLPSTVYGGTLDVSTGVMTVDRAMVTFNGTENIWTGPSSGSGYYQFTAWIENRYNAASSNTAITSYLPLISLSDRGTKSGLVSYASDIGYRFSLNTDMGISTMAQWKAYLAEHPLQLCYTLATSTTITLDPVTINTLLGSNTIYADAGQVSVAYRADVGLYIDKRIAEVQALVLEA